MVFTWKSVYEKIKNPPNITCEEEFIKCCKADNGDANITDEMLTIAFSDLRLDFGQNFKLDNICFLLGNGCSIYAGSKSTTKFQISDAVESGDLKSIPKIAQRIQDKSMEDQLNALITVRDYYKIIGDKKSEVVEKIINQIKVYLLEQYVNAVNYTALNYHEIMLLKLRSYGCLNRVNFYTPNYDLILDYVLDKLGIEYSNGFTGFVNRLFDPKSLHTAKGARLIKIHGSVNWVFDEKENAIKEIQPAILNGKVSVPEAEHVLIFPTEQKLFQTFNAPYSELMRSMLDDFESKRNAILVLGYRYYDEHINEILLKAVANPNNVFYFFDYGDGKSSFIQKMKEISASTKNIHIFLGKFMGNFETFVKYMLPANAEKTDRERIFDLLNKVLKEDAE